MGLTVSSLERRKASREEPSLLHLWRLANEAPRQHIAEQASHRPGRQDEQPASMHVLADQPEPEPKHQAAREASENTRRQAEDEYVFTRCHDAELPPEARFDKGQGSG